MIEQQKGRGNAIPFAHVHPPSTGNSYTMRTLSLPVTTYSQLMSALRSPPKPDLVRSTFESYLSYKPGFNLSERRSQWAFSMIQAAPSTRNSSRTTSLLRSSQSIFHEQEETSALQESWLEDLLKTQSLEATDCTLSRLRKPKKDKQTKKRPKINTVKAKLAEFLEATQSEIQASNAFPDIPKSTDCLT